MSMLYSNDDGCCLWHILTLRLAYNRDSIDMLKRNLIFLSYGREISLRQQLLMFMIHFLLALRQSRETNSRERGNYYLVCCLWKTYNKSLMLSKKRYIRNQLCGRAKNSRQQAHRICIVEMRVLLGLNSRPVNCRCCLRTLIFGLVIFL